MTSLLSARRRAEEFAAVVDGAAPTGPELADLAEVVTALRAQPAPAPREEFAATLRERLLQEAATVLTPTNASLTLPPRSHGRRERRLAAVASAVVLVGGTAGMAAAAQDALPGQALYPVKRGIEQAQSELTPSQAAKGRRILAQADDRLVEVRRLLAGGSAEQAPQVPATIDDFTTQARTGAAVMFAAFREDQDPATVTSVRTFARQALGRLQELARTAPAGAQDDLASAAVALTDIDRQARGVCTTCGTDLPDLSVPRTFLAAAEVRRALQSLRGAHLDNSHPVVVDPRAVKRADKVAPGTGTGTSKAPAGGTLPSPAAPVPTATPDPTGTPDVGGTLQKTTKDLGGTLQKTTKDLGDTVGSTVGGLTDGLSGAAETLLPNPQ